MITTYHPSLILPLNEFTLQRSLTTMTTTTARIFLIRHGDTDWITGGKLASHTEVPLSKQGEVETELIRERLMGEKELIDPMNVAKM